MKQALGAIITLTVIFAFCIFSVHAVSIQANKAYKLTEDAFSAQDEKSAVVAIQKAEAFWRSREWFFGSVLRHDDIEDVVQLYSLLSVYAQRGDWDDYYGNCAALLARLEHIGTTERFRLQNIL